MQHQQMTLMTTEASAGPEAPPPSLFRGPHVPMVLGASALVTLAAFENRAVGTALPSLVREFHAVGAFGLANAAPMASYILALVVSGLWADRRGPARVMQAGIVAFAIAQLLVGAASSMAVVIAGRLFSGFAEGLLDISLTVLVAQLLPVSLRARMKRTHAVIVTEPGKRGFLDTFGIGVHEENESRTERGKTLAK